MNEIQFKILQILYKLKINKQFTNVSLNYIDNHYVLGEVALNHSKVDIDNNIKALADSFYVKFYDGVAPGIEILEDGISIYRKESFSRSRNKLRENELFNAQLDSNRSTIETNKSICITNKEITKNTQDQNKLSRLTFGFIAISTIISFFGVVINFLQYKNRVHIFVL
jgi:hypothetical protein